MDRGRTRTAMSVIAVAMFGALGAGCGTTVSDPNAGQPLASVAAPSDPLPATTPEQLAELVTVTTSLGDFIAAGSSRPSLERIEALWLAASPAVEADDPAAAREFEHQMAQVRKAVERKRPADADKAARNLGVVVEAFLSTHS